MKESLNHVHLLCEDWIRELMFYKDEIPVLKKRLEEVVSKNTDKDILMQVEHFENKFRILATHVDELLHDVNLKKSSVDSQAAAKVNYISVKMIDTDEHLEDLMALTAKDFYENKSAYYKFLSKVM